MGIPLTGVAPIYSIALDGGLSQNFVWAWKMVSLGRSKVTTTHSGYTTQGDTHIKEYF